MLYVAIPSIYVCSSPIFVYTVPYKGIHSCYVGLYSTLSRFSIFFSSRGVSKAGTAIAIDLRHQAAARRVADDGCVRADIAADTISPPE